MIISQLIKDRRLAKGKRQHEIAASVGCCQASVKNWECGKSIPDVKFMLKLAGALGVTLHDLVNSWLEQENQGAD